MPPIRGSIEIARSTEEVFRYAADPTRRREWQETVRAVEVGTPGRVGAGTRVRETRAVTGGDRTFEWEYDRFEAPHTCGFRGVTGPVRPVGAITCDALGGANATRVEIAIDFETSGIARPLAILARRDARKQVPRELAALKQRLEHA
jgi:uncharacterized protein YndB with AHSA1/START domain